MTENARGLKYIPPERVCRVNGVYRVYRVFSVFSV